MALYSAVKAFIRLWTLWAAPFLLHPPHGESFVVAYSKPRLLTVGSVGLEYSVQLLDVCFRYLVCCMINDVVDATEMIDGLHDVIHRCVLCCNSKSVGLEDKTCLFLSQTATLNVI